MAISQSDDGLIHAPNWGWSRDDGPALLCVLLMSGIFTGVEAGVGRVVGSPGGMGLRKATVVY